jgi:hypothetical protein
MPVPLPRITLLFVPALFRVCSADERNTTQQTTSRDTSKSDGELRNERFRSQGVRVDPWTVSTESAC